METVFLAISFSEIIYWIVWSLLMVFAIGILLAVVGLLCYILTHYFGIRFPTPNSSAYFAITWTYQMTNWYVSSQTEKVKKLMRRRK